jgi:hypothetical protein
MVAYKSLEKLKNKGYTDYIKYCETGYPKRIRWEVIAPKGTRLTFAQETDLVFDERDYKIRGLPIPPRGE